MYNNKYRLRNQNKPRSDNFKDAAVTVKRWSAYDSNFFLKTTANYRKLEEAWRVLLCDQISDSCFSNHDILNYNMSVTCIEHKYITYSDFMCEHMLYNSIYWISMSWMQVYIL